MERNLRFLADVPTLATESESPSSWIQIAKQGAFADPRYGEFAITQEDFDAWVQNFDRVNRGQIPVDPDHAPEKKGETEAVGWIKQLQQRGRELWARVDWNSLGRQLIGDNRYRFISPSYTPNYKNDEGKEFGTALVGVALTNRPFLEGMAAVSLTKFLAEERQEPQVYIGGAPFPGSSGTQTWTVTSTGSSTAPNANPGVADSRPQMPELAKIAQALELSDDASEEQILDAIKEATKEPEAPKTLDQLAKDADKVVLDRSDLEELTSQAQAGAEAAKQLRKQRFTQTFDRAVSEGRIDAKDETRERFAALYELDADKTVETLDALPKIVNTESKGSGKDKADAPEGVDPERYQLHQAALAYTREHPDVTYAVALERVSEEVAV